MEIFSRQRIEPDAEIVKPALTYAPKKIITKTLSEKKSDFFKKSDFSVATSSIKLELIKFSENPIFQFYNRLNL
jgi:hypothetical protein